MKKLLLAIWLSWLAISMIGCATVDIRNFSFNDQPEMVFKIPGELPDWMKGEWSGQNLTLYKSDRFGLVAWIGTNPKNEGEQVAVLHALEGNVKGKIGVDWHCYIIAFSHTIGGKQILYIDKSYFTKGISSGRFEKIGTEEWPSLDGIIKMKSGKIGWEI